MSRAGWVKVRKAVQTLAFLSFVYLLFAALQRRAAFPLADLFFRLDPLAALAATLAGREWLPRTALALVTLGLTLALGRVWCGWLCPLGTLLEWATLRPASRKAREGVAVSPRWRATKHFVLLLTLALALFGSLTLLILDPLTLLTRTMTTAIIPALNYIITTVVSALYPVGLLQPALDWLEGLLRGPVLPVKQPVFVQNVLIAGLFVTVLGLNALADRFWCRYLCPLGSLLGLLSKVSLFRPAIKPVCKRCSRCLNVCRLDAIDTEGDYSIVPSECTVCLDCLAACPGGDIGFRLHRNPAPAHQYDPTRRQALAALAAGAVGVALMRTGAPARQRHPLLLRPPGVEDESVFLAHCLRCSQCMKVCPTSGLQPVLTEAGPEGLWTPRLAPRLGYCDYGCNACGQVCPSGAIPRLELDDKRRAVIGLAVVDRNRCLPWARETPCIVCEEMCPLPDKAIKLEEVRVTDTQGREITLQRPHVVGELCIGCGTCEYQCPAVGQAAIQVYTDTANA